MGTRKIDQALQLLDEMQGRGIAPNAITYNTAISACEKAQQTTRVLQLFDEMQVGGIAPDMITYNAVMSACEKAQQTGRALQLLDEMQVRGIAPNRAARRTMQRILVSQTNDPANPCEPL